MWNRPSFSRYDRVVVLLLTACVVVIFGALAWQMIYNLSGTDYQGHIAFTVALVQDHVLSRAHVFFQALLIGVTALLPLTLEQAAVVVSVAFYAFAAVVLYWLVRPALRGAGWRPALFSAGAALALLLVAPVNFLTLPAHNLYFGYITPNALHNPTIVLLRPFALLLFALVAAALEHRVTWGWRVLLLGWLLVLFSLLAKPNGVLVMLPALLVVLGWRVLHRDYADFRLLIGAFVVPMLLFLALEYLAQFLWIDADNSRILFAPLLSISQYASVSPALLLRFGLSALFPLAVYGAYWRKALRDRALSFAWLCFGIGVAQMLLLAESGQRLGDANFWWGAQISLFVLFAVSARFWLRHAHEPPRWRSSLALGVFVLHLVCGILFFALQFYAAGMGDWW
jgi:hypothetical protein